MNRRRGFTLTECVVAIGIVSFALVAIVGLLVVALRALQDSSGDTVRAHMLNAVVAEYRAMNFEEVGEKEFYFDINGVAQQERPAAGFVVRAEPAESAGSGLDLSENFLRRVVLNVLAAESTDRLICREWVLLSDTGR